MSFFLSWSKLKGKELFPRNCSCPLVDGFGQEVGGGRGGGKRPPRSSLLYRAVQKQLNILAILFCPPVSYWPLLK